jgi:alpha-glucosidase
MTMRRAELDGFPGEMTRLREVYTALRNTSPAGDATDVLVDAYQSGDRLSYHPERAVEEIAHFHDVLPKARASVNEMGATFASTVDAKIKLYAPQRWVPGALDVPALAKSRTKEMTRGQALMSDVGK